MLFFVFKVNAQQAYFKNLTVENGLSQSYVSCIIQDSRGMMWLGTQDGLNRYDGSSIKVYKNDKDNPNSVIGNGINTIIELKNKQLLIGTNAGVCTYNPLFDRFKKIDSLGLDNANIKCLLEDKKGRIWIGTSLGLSLKFKTGKSTTYFSDTHNKIEIINVIEASQDGTIWVITANGVYYYDDIKNNFINSYFNGTESTPIIKAVYDGEQQIIIAERYKKTNSSTTITLNIDGKKNSENPIWYNQIIAKDKFSVLNSIKKTSKTELIITTDNNGFYKIKGNKIIQHYFRTNDCNKSAILSSKINCSYYDKQGRLWIGQDLGVSYSLLDNLKFKTISASYFNDNSIKSSDVMSLNIDDDKFIIGTSDDGLYVIDRYNNKQFNFLGKFSFGSQNGVLSILKINNNHFFVGSWGDGVSLFEISSGIVKKEGYIIEGATIITMINEDNAVWIGTISQGLYRYDIQTRKLENFNIKNGLSSNSIPSLLRVGNILWLGTEESGVCFFDLKRNKPLLSNPFGFDNKQLSAMRISHMYHDKANDCVWLATDNGLNKFSFKTKTIEKYYNEVTANTSSYFYAILPDSAGNLWLSTNKGIAKFNTQAENEEALFVNYTTADGLQGMEFNQGAYFADKHGNLYFGGINGFTYFNPSEITSNKRKLPVFFTAYYNSYKEAKLDTAIAYKKHIKLSFKESSIKLYFNSIDYDHPEKIKYSWMLEGYDYDWRPATSDNFADYPLLPPGEYILKVVAINSDGYLNPEAATIHITITPPWYKTKIAYISYLFLLILIGWGYGQLQSSRVTRQNKILEKTVQQRTRQLAEKNRDITSSIEYARKIQEALLPPIADIKRGIKNMFIFYQPRDIVSGDFYWFHEKNGKKIIAVVDCTGHGVPGAFMSMIGHNLLNQIVVEKGILKPSEILNELHKGIEKALKQSNVNSESKDGMDVAICLLNENATSIDFAGAYRTLVLVSGNEQTMITKISGDKYPVGGVQLGETRNFTNHTLHFKTGDMLYMFTDGYADQFGGEHGKKFMMKRFGELLQEASFLSVQAQEELIQNAFNEWKKGYEQVDDVLVVGIRL